MVTVGSAQADSKFTWVSPDYFATMGIPLVRGRGFDQNDTTTSRRVAVVNQTFVRRFAGDGDPIGQRLRTAPEPNYPTTVYEIVGVIPDTKYHDVRGETPPMAFAPASQFPAQGPWANAMIYSNVPTRTLIATLKRKLARKHPDVMTEFADFRQGIQDRLLRERMMAMLSGFFGALAALLVMVGLYGVMSYTVARRRGEIGIRLALGARRAQVIRMVMREATVLLAIGLPSGAVLALLGGRSAGSLLFGLNPYDPPTLIAAVLLLAAIAVAASLIPARRAALLDPVAALRDE
jgi:predicted permease